MFRNPMIYVVKHKNDDERENSRTDGIFTALSDMIIGNGGVVYGCVLSDNWSKPGCPYDNSCVESLFASLKKEKINRRKYDTIEEVKKDVFWYIEIFYHRKRRHSTLNI